ncbi:MAG: hypothetical protein AB9M60_12610 [Leptothrix sp. (in: b-proteobacteria)]
MSEVEPNDTLAKPQVIAAYPALVKGSIASATDTDYYRVTIAGGKRLVATLAPNATSNYDLYVYTAAGQLMGISANGGSTPEVLTISNIGSIAAPLVLRVVRISGGTGATAGAYTLNLAP